MFVRILSHVLSINYSDYIASIVLKPVGSEFQFLQRKTCKLKISRYLKCVA